MPQEILVGIVAVSVVLLILALGIIFLVVLQQRKLFVVQQKNLETLTESEERYRRLVKYSPFPMAVFIHGTIVYVNDAGARLLGVLSPEDLMDKPILDFVNQNFYEQTKQKLKAILEVRKDIAEMEDKLVRRDGQVIDVEITAIPIIYDKRAAIQILVRDITERKRQEAELIAAKERAEQSDKLKDAFIANISHEIRTPLNVILGYSTLITTELYDRIRPEETAFFDSIERGGQRLMRTVEHILNISSIQVGTFQLRPELLDVNARVEKLVQDLSSFATEKGLALRAVLDDTECDILADRYSIDQALTNLIDNAVKFTHEGEVIVRVFRQDQRVCIEVKDTGIGISAEYLPKVFNVFSQEVTGYTRPFEGLGLGLALTKRYVEMNNGSVTVKSRKGQGTTFTLRFMATETEKKKFKTPELASVQSPRIPNYTTREGVKTILVVEDDEQTQEYMRVLFNKDYNVVTASSGNEAWDIVGSSEVDLILMDLSLRGNEDGLQLTVRIRNGNRNPNVPIIVVTAHAFPEDREKSLQAGCDMYFSKPFQIEDLKNSIRSFIGSGG